MSIDDDTDHPELRSITLETVEGLKNSWDKVLALCKWISDFITADKPKIDYNQVRDILESPYGSCLIFSQFYVAAVRIAGLECRKITGIIGKEVPGSHACVEVYYPESGHWRYIEPQLPNSLGLASVNHIIDSISEDPHQKGASQGLRNKNLWKIR